MSYYYFACDWIIKISTAKYLFEVIDVATKLDCKLVILKSSEKHRDQKDGQGYVYDIYAIRVPSMLALEEFIKTIGREMGLGDWYSISELLFLTAEDTLDDFEIGGRVSKIHSWYFEGAGILNDRLQAASEGKDRYSWLLKELELNSNTLTKLEAVGMQAIGDLQDILVRGRQAFLQVPGFDEQLLDELLQVLREKKYWPIENGVDPYQG